MTTDQTCEQRIDTSWARTRETLRAMLLPVPSDWELADDGTLDTVLVNRELDSELRIDVDTAADYRDESGALDLDALIDDYWDGLTDECYNRFAEYGLEFSPVEAVRGEGAGYWRFLMSWGGPSDELRIYPCGRIAYVFQDWGDSADRIVTGDDVAEAVADHFDQCEMMRADI